MGYVPLVSNFLTSCKYIITDFKFIDCFKSYKSYFYYIGKSNPLQALVLFNKLSVDNLNSVPECVVLTDDDIRHTFIKHSCDVQEIPQVYYAIELE